MSGKIKASALKEMHGKHPDLRGLIRQGYQNTMRITTCGGQDHPRPRRRVHHPGGR